MKSQQITCNSIEIARIKHRFGKLNIAVFGDGVLYYFFISKKMHLISIVMMNCMAVSLKSLSFRFWNFLMFIFSNNMDGNLYTFWLTLDQLINGIYRFSIHLKFGLNIIIQQKKMNVFLFQQFLNNSKMDYQYQEQQSQQKDSGSENKEQYKTRKTTPDNENKSAQLIQVPSKGRKNIEIDPSEVIRGLNIRKKLSQVEIGEIMYLIFYILNFPSLEEAQSHTLANRLGSLDIKKENCVSQIREYCKCCGSVKQNQKIPLCTSFSNFPSVGISIYLFFETVKSLIMLLALVLIVHDIFALVSNLYIACAISQKNPTFSLSNLIDWMSLNSKVKISNQDNQSKINNLYLVQMWLGTAMVVLWSLLLYLIKYYERKYEVMVDKQTVSAADFSIIIQNYPRLLTKENLQSQLNQYAQQLQCQNPNIFTIEQICLNTDSTLEKMEEEEMQEINQKYTEMMEMFADWICCLQETGELPYDQTKRGSIYQKFQKVKNQRLVQGKRIFKTLYKRKNVQQSSLLLQKQNQKIGKTIAVVTFKFSQSKHIISRHNQMNLAKKIRYYLRCCPSKTRLHLKDENGVERDINIERAPEPEDIKWENLSFSITQKIIRKGFTYFVTLLLLSVSFAIVYFLSSYERKNQDNQYLNFLVSIIISIVNFTIGFLIRFLTVFQKDYTQTGYQTSLAVKSIWAQLLNSIAVPIVVNYIIEEKNIFGSSGLSTDIVYLSITNSFLPPLTRLFDPYHKYILLKALYYRKSLKQRLLMKQVQFNQTQELMQFEAGYEYIYFINLYLFTAYFVTLQPCISIFAILGMFLMYWVEKYSLLNRMKRPVPGTDLVNNAMIQLVNLGPLFYSLGALSWSHLLDGYKVREGDSIYYVPNIITAGLSALFFIFPFNVIFDKYLPKLEIEDLEYQQCRILLNSEYKRTNPATMEEAIKEYEEYLQNYMKKQQSAQFQQAKQFAREKLRKKSQNHKKCVGFAENQCELKLQKNEFQQSQIEFNKKKNERSDKRKKTVNNMEIDQKYLTRKKQMLRQRTRIRSTKIGSDVNDLFEDVIQNDLNEKDKNSEENQNNEENQTLEKQKNQLLVPPDSKPFKLDNKVIKDSVNSSLKKQRSFFRGEKIQSKSFEQNENSFNVMSQVKNKMINSNRQGLTKEYSRLPKQTQTKPRKIVDIDFAKFLPLNRENSGPQKQRDNNYVNFFAQNLLMKNQGNKISKMNPNRKNNPYEYSFR